MVTILMVPAKLTTPGLLKIKILRNEGFDVIILAMTSPTKLYHVTQIIL